MGCSYYAIGGIGYMVNLNNINFDKVIVHSCEHPERVGNVFCPKCGTKVTETIEDTSDMFYDVGEAFEKAVEADPNFIWESFDDEHAIYFLGYGASASDRNWETESLPPIDYDEVKAAIKLIVLKAQKLYEEDFEEEGEPPQLSAALHEDDFGVHIGMRVSC